MISMNGVRPLRIFIAPLTALLLVFMAGRVAGQAPNAEGAGIAMPVKVVLFPFREAVLASNVSAPLREYKFKEGEAFKADEPLALLDDRQYQQIFIKAKAASEEIKAILRFSEENLKRNQELFAKNAIGFQEMEQSRLDKDRYDAQLQASLASLKLAELDLAACSIKVPFAGRVTKRIVKEHQFVRAADPIIEVIDDSSLLADMHLPSNLRPSMKLGDELEMKIDETGTVCKGKVYEIGGRIDFESRTFEVRALVENSSHKLSAGMSGVLIEGKP